MTWYSIYKNCPLCGCLYSSISYPKYEDGMIVCPCTEETVINQRILREEELIAKIVPISRYSTYDSQGRRKR